MAPIFVYEWSILLEKKPKKWFFSKKNGANNITVPISGLFGYTGMKNITIRLQKSALEHKKIIG